MSGGAGSETDAWRQRFYREAKSAGRLNHPNIVTIYDVGESEDVAYIAMEFLGGQSLREILDSGTVLPPARIAEIAAQVADGLAFAHQNGVVHRDIKPANIMVLDSGAVKITDFGIARLSSGTRTVAGTIFGSPKYISPERLQGFEVDGRSDIFSLGAVLYEMLTDFPPFFGGDLGAIMHQVLEVMPAPPSSRNRRFRAASTTSSPRLWPSVRRTATAMRAEMAADLRNFADLKPPVEAARIAAPAARRPMCHVARRRSHAAVASRDRSDAGSPARVARRSVAACRDSQPASRCGSKAIFAIARDPRLPTVAVSGLAVVVLAALAGWALLPGRTTNGESHGGARGKSASAPAASRRVQPIVPTHRANVAGQACRRRRRRRPAVVAQGTAGLRQATASGGAGGDAVGRSLCERQEDRRFAADDGTQTRAGEIHGRNPQHDVRALSAEHRRARGVERENQAPIPMTSLRNLRPAIGRGAQHCSLAVVCAGCASPAVKDSDQRAATGSRDGEAGGHQVGGR